MARQPAPPTYATGGGGTRLEHRYGATLLAALLTGDPHPELGDALAIGSVHFQAAEHTAVDDFLIQDSTGTHTAVIAVRRAPRLNAGSAETVQLIAALLTELRDYPLEIAASTRTLHLITASSAAALTHLDRLTELARDSTADTFRTAAGSRLPVRAHDLLARVDEIVGAAAATIADLPADPDLTWRLLSSLRRRPVHLEGDDQSDRTATVTALRHVLDPVQGAADRLFSRLDELAGHYASRGSTVTAPQLRRDCRNHPLRRASQHQQAWQRLDRLQRRLADNTPGSLPTPSGPRTLPRTDALAALTAALQHAATDAGTLLIHGEPDVGKSALALRAGQQLGEANCRVWSISLRDLPAQPLALTDSLGTELSDLLDSDRPAATRLLILDGGETVLEGWADLIGEVTRTLPPTGVGVAIIARDDALDPLTRILSAAPGASRIHQVPPLDDTDLPELLDALPHLQDLQRDERGSWLLHRPGLVEMLLQVPLHLPDDQTLTEADLYTATWQHLVRRDEGATPGRGSPDSRERTLLHLARAAVAGASVLELPLDSEALAGLRSDGLLRSRDRASAATPGDDFRNDLIRDFSVARLLLSSNALNPAHPPPRWVLRAARIAAQARLRADPSAATLQQLQDQYGRLTDRGGTRWGEVPLEAVLALADDRLFAALETDRPARGTLRRLALQRHRTGTAGDPRVFTALLSHLSDTAQPDGRDDREQQQEFVLSWLRGLQAATTAQPHRQRWRNTLLARDPEVWDEWAIEAVATLGGDLDDQAVAYLRRVAQQQPYHLAAVVESPWAVQDLAVRNWPLLNELTEAYYFDHDTDEPVRLDYGIRPHRRTGGLPMASWFDGPFWVLLRHRPVEAITTINRILNHATSSPEPTRWGAPPAPPDHLEVPLDDGVTTLYDRGGSWAWYRGGGRGPSPCVSALLAVERLAEQILQHQPAALPALHRMLLTGCENTAMAGLIVGLLVRHLDRVGPLLDPWLQVPGVWTRELARATEARLHPHPDGDPSTLTLTDVAHRLVFTAITNGDHARQAGLASIGATLAAAAVTGNGFGNSAGWAAALDAANYRETTLDGRDVIEFNLPEAVIEANASTAEYLQRRHEAMRLQSTYLHHPEDPDRIAQLLADVNTARTLQRVSDDQRDIGDAVAAVAAAVLRFAALHQVPVPAETLLWAEPTLLRLLIEADPDPAETIWPFGADRSAAAAIPLLLLLDDGQSGDLALDATLRYAATSSTDEIRLTTALGAQPVWAAACVGAAPGPCSRHRPLLDAVLAASSQPHGDNPPPQLTGTPPLPPAHLVPLLLHAAAARHARCVSEHATIGLRHLLQLHREALIAGTEHGYRPTRQPLAELLVTEAVAGRLDPLADHAATLLTHPRPLTDLLHDVGEVFTYDPLARTHLAETWPTLLQRLLPQLVPPTGNREHDLDHWATAALLPVPRLRPADDQLDQTYRNALATGIPLPTLAPLMPSWLPQARHAPKAVDDLVLLLRCDDRPAVHPLGLTWLDAAIGDDFRTAARAGRVADWLRHIRHTVLHDPDAEPRWHRLVDGLAAAGDLDAAALQQEDEA